MKRKWLWTLALSLGIVASAVSGNRYVSGPVSGKWEAGTNVVVESAIWVADGEALVVEEGVTIEFLTKDRFVIDGNLQMMGTSRSRVTIKPSINWEGMLFNYDRDLSSWHILSHVVVESSGILAKRIIETDRVAIRIDHCEFVSRQNSIRIIGGRLQAENNSFLTYASSSKVIEIRNLENTSDSYLRTNLIQIEGDSPYSGVPVLNDIACGVQISGTTRLEILDNKIQLWMTHAPSCGFDIANTGTLPDDRLTIDRCVVKVETPGIWACAVRSIHYEAVFVDIIKSTMDIIVNGDANAQRPIAIRADNHASINMNTNAFQLSSPHEEGVPYLVGANAAIDVSYSVRWHERLNANSLSSMSGLGDDYLRKGMNDELIPVFGDYDALSDLPPNVNENEVIFDQNPGFIRNGSEGIWHTHNEVETYYGLTAGSPCRDAGDPNLDGAGDDRPDAGRYDFVMVSVSPDLVLPSEFAVSRAYPNPFNPSTTITIEMSQSGLIQMTLYDILGRVARNVYNGRMNSGSHYVKLDGGNLASGVYLLSTEFNGKSVNTQRVVFMK